MANIQDKYDKYSCLSFQLFHLPVSYDFIFNLPLQNTCSYLLPFSFPASLRPVPHIRKIINLFNETCPLNIFQCARLINWYPQSPLPLSSARSLMLARHGTRVHVLGRHADNPLYHVLLAVERKTRAKNKTKTIFQESPQSIFPR